MKYFKHTLWLASLLVLLLPGCNIEEEVTPMGGDLTLTLTIPEAQQSTRAITDPLPGESTITNVYLLFYKQGVDNGDKPIFFHNTGSLNATDGMWMKSFPEKDLPLKSGDIYDVYALASINIGLAKSKLPTSNTTKGELLALNDYRCYCESDQAVSFSATTTYTGGDALLPISLMRTVARFDVTTDTLPLGQTLRGIGIDNAPAYSPFFTNGATTTGKDSIFHTPEAVTRFYPFSTTGLTPEADHRMKISVYTVDTYGFEDIYTASIDKVIERNTIYKIHVTLNIDKTLTLTMTHVQWTRKENASNGAIDPGVPTTSPKANAYLVAPGGNPVFIPVSQANDAKLYNSGIAGIGTGDELTAELVWTDVISATTGKGIACDAPVQEISLLGKGSEAILKVIPGTVPGNALIAVKDKATNVIRWSWHIWVTKMEEKTYTNSGITYTLMDRHLGATSITPGDLNTYGLAYQWGRKDPFPQAGATTAGYATPRVFYDAAGKELVESKGYRNNNFTIAQSVADPWQMVSSGSSQWASDKNGNMWGITKTVYDPCPAGWRVPERKALEGITAANATNTSVGAKYVGRTHVDLGFFPVAGRRYEDVLKVENAGVYCFLNVSDGSDGSNFPHFRFTTGNTLSFTNEPCEYAISVRCLKIVTP